MSAKSSHGDCQSCQNVGWPSSMSKALLNFGNSCGCKRNANLCILPWSQRIDSPPKDCFVHLAFRVDLPVFILGWEDIGMWGTRLHPHEPSDIYNVVLFKLVGRQSWPQVSCSSLIDTSIEWNEIPWYPLQILSCTKTKKLPHTIFSHEIQAKTAEKKMQKAFKLKAMLTYNQHDYPKWRGLMRPTN
jgi:hypothetical protein